MITIINNYDHINKDGHYQSTIIYEGIGGFGGITSKSPAILTLEDSLKYFLSNERQIYLWNLELYLKVVRPKVELKRLNDAIFYCLLKDIQIKEICEFMVKLEAGLRRELEVIKLPERLEYVNMLNWLMLHINNKLNRKM